MGFPIPVTSDQKATTRASGYWQRTFIAFNPGDIVFQAEADETIDDAPFKSFEWTNTLEGAYTDVWQGMLCYISSTTDYQKDFKYRGRVRLAPSSTEFRIDLNATTLETGDIITVVRDADLFARVRENTLVDGSVAYHNLPPMTEGLPSVVVLYDADNDGDVEWTPDQTGIPVADGATIDTYAWAVSGTGTSSISDDEVQNPDFVFEAGEHYLVRLVTTDSNGVSNFILVQVYAISRTFTAPVILPAAAGSVSQNLSDGYSGSVTAYGGVANLPYRAHAVVFAVEHFGDNSSTPINTNVLMYGRLRSESITTEGSDEGGAIQTVTYPIEGLTSYMRRLKMPNDIVRSVTSPDEWGEMVNPTPYRMAVYALFAYSTLLNLVSFSAGDSLFIAWKKGGEPSSIDGGFALDVLTTLMAFVDAAPNFAPDGEIRNEINASQKVDRSGLITIMDFLVQDARAFTLDIDTSQITAQVVGYGGMWNTVNNTFVYFTASAPTVPYTDAPESRELTRLLLQTDNTISEANAELAARTGNDYAVNNPKWMLNVTLRDAHRWIVATNYQRYTWTLSAIYNLREIAITTAIKWQIQSVDITINTDGTYDVGAEFVQETEFSDAQSIANLLPANLEDMNPVFPELSDDLAFPDAPEWMYPTDNPSPEEQQPIGSYSAIMSWSPFPPDQAAEAAEKQDTIRCKAFQVNMRNPGTTLSPFFTAIGESYTLYIGGFGRIAENTAGVPATAENGGNGYDTLLDVTAGDNIMITCLPGDTWEGGTGIPYNADGDPGVFNPAAYDPTAEIYSMIYRVGTSGAWAKAGLSVAFTAASSGRLYLMCNDIPAGHSDNSGTITATVTGLTASPTEYGDAYYRWRGDGEMAGEPELFDPTAGLLIDGNKPGILPDYSPAHTYTVPFTGTDNQIQGAYALADYTDVANKLITIKACVNP
jgi:hypothetical protein